MSDPTAQKLKIRLLLPIPRRRRRRLHRLLSPGCSAAGVLRAPLLPSAPTATTPAPAASNSGGAMWLWKWGGVGARRRRTGRAGCVLLLPAPATSSKHITSPQPGTTIQIRSQYWLITKCIQSFLVFSAKLIQYIH